MNRSEAIAEITKMLEKLSDRYVRIIYYTVKKLLEQG